MEAEESEKTRRSRKSDRPRKRKKAYSPEPQLDSKRKPKTIPKTQQNRPYDILPNGEPFSCTLCKSPYVVNIKGSKKTVRSRHTPLPKIRIDQTTGREMQLCNACAQSFDRPRHRTKKPEVVPTEDEQEAYLNEAKVFTKILRDKLDVPNVDKLFCPVSKKKLCGCLQRYIKTEMMLSGIACVQIFVNLMAEAEELRKEKVYSPSETKAKAKTSIGLGNGHKKSKRYEEFVITKRRDLKEDMRLCERATQRVLMYSNNFLHKKLKTEERPCRIERTRGKAALGKLPEIHTMVEMVCCSENCVMMALTHRKLLQSWRERSKLGQTETRRVLAEMLTPAGANHRNCYHFIGYVTGCSPSTIGRVYTMMMESSGNREPPEHGMKRVWQENYKQNKVVSHDGEKSLSENTEEPSKQPMVTEPRLIQRPGKLTNQRLVNTTTETNVQQMQFELQKQQLARIQMDLIEKQHQLEQQQVNLQLQLMAQQASVHPDNTQTNQLMLQQLLHQISQQQFQNAQIIQEQGKSVTSQPDTSINQSVQTGSLSQTVSLPKQSSQQVLNVNYINGEIHFSLSGANQSTESCDILTPATLQDSTDRHDLMCNRVVMEGNIDNCGNIVLNQLNVQRNQIELNGAVQQIQIPEGYADPRSTATLVNTNSLNFDIGSTVNNLPNGEVNGSHIPGNQSASVPCNTGTSEQLLSDQSKQSTYIISGATPVSICNFNEQVTVQSMQAGSNNPRYEMHVVPGITDNSSRETSQSMIPTQNLSLQGGQMRLNGVPIQLLDSNGQQYQLVSTVQDQEETSLVSPSEVLSQEPMANMVISQGSPAKQPKSTLGGNPGQSHVLYNVIGNNTLTQNTVSETSILDHSQINLQPVSQDPNIQFTVHEGNQEQTLDSERLGENGAHPTQIHVDLVNTMNTNYESNCQQVLSPDGLLTVPLYGTAGVSNVNGSAYESNSKASDKTLDHELEQNQHPKRNVQFKNIQESMTSQENNMLLKDIIISHENSLVNPDMVLPRPHPRSRSRQSSGNSARSRQSSGNPTRSRQSSGNSSLNVDSFKQFSSSFKLKDLAKTGSSLSGNRSRKSSGDRLRQSSGDRSRQTSGDRSRHPSSDRSRQTSGDRSRQPSGNSMFGEFSSFTNISPNLFFSKDKNVFFLQAIDSISGGLDDIQSPDLFNSSPTNAGNAPITEISLPETGRVEFENNFMAHSLLQHDTHQCETDGITLMREQSHYNSLNQAPPAVAVVNSEPSGQKAIKNPILNSILSRPPKNISD